MKIAIIGAGTMGGGIAVAFAAAGNYSVLLCDVSTEFAEKGLSRIEARLGKSVERGKMEAAAAQKIIAAITVAERKTIGDCDLVIEAALEDLKLKKDLFADLDKICGENTLFATNTSSCSITAIASGLSRPVTGMHFFNPAETMKLVEIIPGLNTPPEQGQKLMTLAADIGKTPVLVRDSAGFVVNRVLIPMINEAVAVLAEGVASAEDIDAAMKLGAAHPMGPLALGDLVGLDVCLAIMEVLHSEFGDRYKPHPLMRQMVRGGLLGRKSGRGFFTYN